MPLNRMILDRYYKECDKSLSPPEQVAQMMSMADKDPTCSFKESDLSVEDFSDLVDAILYNLWSFHGSDRQEK